MLKNNKNLIPLLLFGSTFIIYTYNLSPGVYGGDSGDFLAAIITKGVPHPSGYPLYTMLGILFLKLPLAATPAWKVGLLSATFSSLGVVAMYLISLELTKSRYLAIITALTLAFTYPFWLYAEIAEVFALNSFFILTLIYITLRYFSSKKYKYLYILAFVSGLSLTNNLTIVLLFPGLAIALLLANKKLITNFSLIFKFILVALVGLATYLYIPLSAASNSFYSWGSAVNLKNFVRVIFRTEYGWGVTSRGLTNTTNIARVFQNYFFYWQEYVNPIIPILIFLGLIYLVINKKTKHLVLLTISFVLLGPFFIYYSRNPISSLPILAVHEKFYIASIIVALTAVPFGILLIKDFINSLKIHKSLQRFLTRAVFLTFLIIPISSFLTGFRRLDLSNIHLGDNFAIDLLNSLPNKSIAMLTADTKVFNSYYMQYAYDFRKDIYIPGRPDSFRGLIREAGLSGGEVEEYVLERGGTIDRSTYALAVPNVILETNVFSDHTLKNMQLTHQEYGNVVFVPWGLVNKLFFEKTFDLTKEEYIAEMKKITSQYQIDQLNNHEEVIEFSVNYSDIQISYAAAYFSIAEFIAEYYQDTDASLYFLKKSLELDPLAQPVN